MAETEFADLVKAFADRFGTGPVHDQRFMVELYRQLADGEPVRREVLADALDIQIEDVAAALDKLPSFYIGFDDEQRIIEWGGFGLDGGNNDFTIRGHRMWAWCAWDGLFVPAIVGEPARVAADDPKSGARVALTVTPDGVTDVSPPSAVMTFALPGMEAFPDFRRFSFQKTVFYFESRESAKEWLARNPGPILISLEEGFEFGRTLNRVRFPDIPEIAAPSITASA